MCCSLTKYWRGKGKVRKVGEKAWHEKSLVSVSTKFDHYCSPPWLRIADSLNKAQGKWIKKSSISRYVPYWKRSYVANMILLHVAQSEINNSLKRIRAHETKMGTWEIKFLRKYIATQYKRSKILVKCNCCIKPQKIMTHVWPSKKKGSSLLLSWCSQINFDLFCFPWKRLLQFSFFYCKPSIFSRSFFAIIFT